ncbi:hypothetical protein [Brevundimonas sp.]|uniref:hypothetical protein n=1 Tax=Brevundimonas sp. TaxID=1871086 RepID=UPI002ABA44A1|nr:hypothetical protein [Brevundimonas sp.]MDZ4363391.1 hypothetical protein [Brevundimonas sp.]
MTFVRLTPEQLTARNRRNRAIATGLIAFMVLIFVVTALNLKRNIDARAALNAPVAAPVAAAGDRAG